MDAIGFSVHTGWAVAVVVSDAPALLAKARVEICGGPDRFAFHHAAGLPIVGVAALAPEKPLPGFAEVLASHARVHAAEGVLFASAIASACADLGIRVARVAPESVPKVGKIAPPWGKDQKLAAGCAFAALRARRAT